MGIGFVGMKERGIWVFEGGKEEVDRGRERWEERAKGDDEDFDTEKEIGPYRGCIGVAAGPGEAAACNRASGRVRRM